MKIAAAGAAHLTYCTNVHPGETLNDVERMLHTHVPGVRQQMDAAQFGVGLRLAARAVEELAEPAALERFKSLLNEQGLYVFTLNGFPYGAFHQQRVKEQVYEPDWRTEARLSYTNRLAHTLVELLPEGVSGSISTVPVGFRPNIRRDDEPQIVTNLLRHVAELHHLREQTGRTLALGLEPEPHCYLETLSEAAEFLERGPLSSAGVSECSKLTGLGLTQAEDAVRRHLGVCLDACHMAVEFEQPAAVIEMLKTRGIGISKLQVSAGLRCELSGKPGRDATQLSGLRAFADDVYLHQVVERRGGTLNRYLDLSEAFAAYERSCDGTAREWRIHFHVPVFMETVAQFSSTRADLQQLLALQRHTPFTSHLEVETYTWDVLPEEGRTLPLTTAIARELQWTLTQLRSESP